MQKDKKYFELQKSAQLTNQEAADLFEVNISTIKRWRNGKLNTPRAVILYLELKSELKT